MATIGLTIESGAMHAVLVDDGSGAVVASQVTALRGGESSALPAAVAAMRTAAARRDVDVDAVGVVYRSEDERDRFAAAISDAGMDDTHLVSATAAFLGWLARSSDFESATRVLLYYLSETGVSISLADAAGESISTPKTATLDSMSPERIGSTVPLAWEVLDAADRKPDSVALFGDRSSSRNVVDILSLGLGVPVIHVGHSDRIAAQGAALVVAENVTRTAGPVAAIVASKPAEAVPVPAMTAPVEVDAMPSTAAVSRAMTRRRPMSRRNVVLAAALLAGIASGGVALASTLPQDPDSATAVQEPAAAPTADVEAGLLAATQPAPATLPPSAPAPAPAPPVQLDPVTQLPVPTQAPTTTWTTEAPAGTAWRSEALTPIPASAIPPAAAVVPSRTVDPPEFAVPTVVPEPGKSQEQLEQEAWNRHWQQTTQWLQQEIVGG